MMELIIVHSPQDNQIAKLNLVQMLSVQHQLVNVQVICLVVGITLVSAIWCNLVVLHTLFKDPQMFQKHNIV